jgi:putative transposase
MYPVTVLCRLMAVSTRAFYTCLKTPADTDKVQRKAVLEAKARQLFNDHMQTYGYWGLYHELHPKGIKASWT